MTIDESAERLHSLLSNCLATRRAPASVLVVGPSRHALLSQVLDRIAKDESSVNVIRLDGRIHGTRQIDLSSLLLKPPSYVTRQRGKRSPSTYYSFVVLDVFDRWAANPLQQPFLYQLLNGEHRLCVIGLAQCSDALECLEKRVRSRHSQIVIYAPSNASESIEDNSAYSYWQEVSEAGSLCTANELLVLVLIKRILERRHPAGSLGAATLQSFALAAIHEEYTIIMTRGMASDLLVKPVSRNALRLAIEGLLLKRLIVQVDANGGAYALYRLDRLLRSMITDVVSLQARNGIESLHQLLTRF